MLKKKVDKKFQKRLVLNSYLLSKLGMTNFEEIQFLFKNPENELIDNEGHSKFISKLILEFETKLKITKEELLEYDNNIITALKFINEKREKEITLKYYQYFSLLFVEIYLDSFFSDKDSFLKELNEYLLFFNNKEEDNLPNFLEDDINKLALWAATGSGKTILMHLNYYQIKHYINKYNKIFEGTYILLTPNEGLSRQHLNEFQKANINASIYNKNISKDTLKIEIIENTKLAEKDGEKTVSIERFGNQNIIFVDEGHRGTSGDTWYKYRNELCKKGFSFEYSATFGQAIKASNKKELEEEYAKCIYFDYSYKHFYNDGFGKDYQILNLNSNEENIRNLYLTASLLTFYQQKKIFKNENYTEFNIENPLMIFIGSSVNAIRKEQKKDISDVIEILLFLNDFISNKNKYSDIIERILNEKTGLLGESNIDIFRDNFNYIETLNFKASELYQDLILEIFHENISGSMLHIEYLKGSDGEIQLKLGNNAPFGLINVGDALKLIKLCDENNLNVSEIDFAESLFVHINEINSPINILIGSKKFIEGWNSWRVSSMGLMNIGKSEGSQVIQLFGRGVRLKGKNMSLKRSLAYFVDYPNEKEIINYKYLNYLETLNIFGLKADYMEQFKEYLESEGIDLDEKSYFIDIPVIKNKNFNKLITLKLKDNLDFKRDGKIIIPGEKEDKFIIVLDCYGKVQFQSSRKKIESYINKNSNNFDILHLSLLDYNEIYFEIQKYKDIKGYHNFIISKSIIKNLLNDNSWYNIQISDEDIKFKTLDDISRFNRIAIALLKKYVDKKYTVSKSKWETPLLKYEYLNTNDSNFIKNNLYNIEIRNKEQNNTKINFLEILKKEIENLINQNEIPIIEKIKGGIGVIGLSEALYSPYIYLAKQNIDIKITPIALNESEWRFITSLKEYLINNEERYQDYSIYVTRNSSKKGIGFFEDNGFYPDFILWIIKKEKYYITFIEPHGMRNEDINSEKVQLYKKLKEYEKTIDKNDIEVSSPILNSFICSPTKRLDIVAKYSEKEWNENHVFFMDNKDYISKIFDTILIK